MRLDKLAQDELVSVFLVAYYVMVICSFLSFLLTFLLYPINIIFKRKQH